MSKFNDNMENLKKLREALKMFAPKTAEGKLSAIYKKALEACEKDIARAERWMDG